MLRWGVKYAWSCPGSIWFNPNGKSQLNPVAWQAGDHWEFACVAAETGYEDLAVEAFVNAIRMNRPDYTQQVRPQGLQVIRCWQTAIGKSG